MYVCSGARFGRRSPAWRRLLQEASVAAVSDRGRTELRELGYRAGRTELRELGYRSATSTMRKPVVSLEKLGDTLRRALDRKLPA